MKYVAKVWMNFSSGEEFIKTFGPFRARVGKTPEAVAKESAIVIWNPDEIEVLEICVVE